MIKDLLLHDITRNQLVAMAANPPHAILLIGPAGSGKKTLALNLASEITGIPSEKLKNHPAMIEIKKPADKSEIPIDSIRGLIKSLSLRATEARRAVLIGEAGSLSEEAQNSLLKLIEEPPQRTVFILAIPALSAILPTVASRTQKIKLLPVTQRQATEFYDGQYDHTQVKSAWLLGRAAPGAITAILEQSSEHQLKKAVDTAKVFLRMSRYDRLVYLDGLAANKDDFSLFLDALDRVLAALAVQDINRDEQSRAKRVLKARQQINTILESLARNTNPKLLAVDLALSLPV